jgi:hypothetical protein
MRDKCPSAEDNQQLELVARFPSCQVTNLQTTNTGDCVKLHSVTLLRLQALA